MKSFTAISVSALIANAAKLDSPWMNGTTLVNSDNITEMASQFNFDDTWATNGDFVKGVNTISDEYIAIEAFSNALQTLGKQIGDLKSDADNHKDVTIPKIQGDLTKLQGDVAKNKQDIATNNGNLLKNWDDAKGLADKLEDLAGRVCLNEKALVLFCHRFIFAPTLPAECVPILYSEAEHLNWQYAFVTNQITVSPQKNVGESSLACTLKAEDWVSQHPRPAALPADTTATPPADDTSSEPATTTDDSTASTTTTASSSLSG